MARTKTLATTDGDALTSPKVGKAERSKATRKPKAALAESPSAPASRSGLTPENRRFFRYLAAFAGCGFTVLSLVSYSPTDPAFSRRSSVDEIANWGGRSGAVVSDLLLQVFGYAAWSVLPLTLWLILRFARRPGASVPKLFLGALGAWWFATLLGLLSYPDGGGAYPVGGVLGLNSAALLLTHLGAVGSYVAVMVFLVAGAALLFDVDWERLAGRGVDAVRGGSPILGRALARSGSAAIGAVASSGRAAWSATAGRLGQVRSSSAQEPETTEWEALTWDESLSSALDRTPAMPLPLRIDPPAPGPRTLAFHSLHEPELDEPEEKTVWAERDLVEVEVTATTNRRVMPILTEVLPEDDEEEVQKALHASSPRRGRSALDAPELDALSLFKEVKPAAPPVVVPPPPAPLIVTPPVDEPAPAARAAQPKPAPKPTPKAAPPPPPQEEQPWDVEDEFFGDQGLDAEDEDEPGYDSDEEASEEEEAAPVLRPSRPGRPVRATIQPGNLESGGDDGGDEDLGPRRPQGAWQLPSLALLDVHDRAVSVLDEDELKQQAAALVEKLANFNIKGEVVAIRPGPVITIFEYLPAPGIKVSRIAALADDLAMALRALRVRIVAPIPGKGVVGIEIPNKERQTVWYRDVLVSNEMRENDWVLPMALGKTPEGRPSIADLNKMPHLLVGGTTGSGKSVGVNAMLMTMLYHRTPDELRMILIDPKMLEFELYQDIPHLLHPVVTEPKLASAALKWACKEMDDRYRLLARWGTRNIASYNKKVEQELESWTDEKAWRYAPRNASRDQVPPRPRTLPYIVIVIDELADLMMVAAKDVEEAIVRLAQKARACGIHLIVATQRPSVDVITGLIKANMPARIAFQVRSKTDGRTILDQNGAETLLGKGDMLYLPPGVSSLGRVHGPFVADEEVQRVADFWRAQGEPVYEADIRVEDEEGEQPIGEDEYDECYDLAVQIVTEAGKASTSMIQRRLKIGYNRAARIIEMMERDGLVGPADGARPRDVLVGNG